MFPAWKGSDPKDGNVAVRRQRGLGIGKECDLAAQPAPAHFGPISTTAARITADEEMRLVHREKAR